MPEEVAKGNSSYTGRFLRLVFKKSAELSSYYTFG